jgi:hypothetical protein
MPSRPTCLRLGLVAAVLALAALAGCRRGSGRENAGTVWGTVYFQDRPLPGGTIHFVRSKADKTSLWIRGDGTYSGEIPVGQAKVAVETESVKFTDRDTMFKLWRDKNPSLAGKKQKRLDVPRDAPKMVFTRIPDAYANPETSGLTCEVVAGEQKQDFTLR